MFKRSRRKIVAAIMSVLVLLWVGTLAVIYASSYYDMTRENEQMLKAHADMYEPPQDITLIPPDMPPESDHGFAQTPMFRLSTFYSVALSYDGKVLEIKNEQPMIHDDKELKELALDVADGERSFGVENGLSYYMTDKGGYTLVVFKDNTVMNENASTLFKYTLIFGAVTLVVFFFLSRYLAKRIVRPLEESYLKQKQFISDAGHELKTPVSVIGANAELLERELGDNAWLSNIRYENERMSNLISQLLELARSESTAQKTERIDLGRLVAGETLPFESVAFEHGLCLKSSIAEGIFVDGNAASLKQLVSILLDNAISHAKGGDITLTLKKEHGNAMLTVVNLGDEIPKEQREKLFERFYRTDTARGSEGGHYGLGLAIAKAVCDAHKGRIEVFCHDGLVEFTVKLSSI